MRKLRIGLLIETLHRHGGLERRTCRLAEGLIDAGHEVHIFANGWERDACPGAVCHKVPMLKLSRVTKDLSFAWVSSILAARQRLDIHHTQTRLFSYDIATFGGGCYMAYLDAMKMRGSECKHRVALAMERAMLSPEGLAGGRRIILNSRKCRDEYIEYYGVPEENLEVVYNGVDREVFSPETRSLLRPEARRQIGLPDDDVAVLFVGSGYLRKGLDTLVQALRGTPSSVKVLVLGRGKRNTYNRLAEEAGVGDRLIWLGESLSGSVTEFYAAADIYALPTRYDPFANTTLEALACGLPTITTSANGVAEIMHTGEDGFVLPAGDVDALADVLYLLAGNETLRSRIGESGARIAEEFTWERTTRETMAVYRRFLEARER